MNSENERFEDTRFDGLTNKLRATFEQQGGRFEPSNDSYARLAEAIKHSERASGTSWWWLRPLSVGIAVVVVLGVGGILMSLQGSDSVASGPGGLEAADDGQELKRPSSRVARPIVGPVAPTRLEAGQAFLEFLGYPFASLESDGDRVVVRSFVEGEPSVDGEGVVAATLTVSEVDGGYAVAEASTESVSISAMDTSDLTDGKLRVDGEGAGFEGALSVSLVAVDGVRSLASVSVDAGALGEPEPYTVEIPVVGSEHAWVVIASPGGASGVTEPFAARSISYSSIDDPGDYTVVGVRADDPDGGLLLRNGPGVGNESFAVLAPGATGIRRSNVLPVSVGDDVWWAIEADDEDHGWVNSRFLASAEPVDDEQLRRIAEDARSMLSNIAAQEGQASPAEPLLAFPFSNRIPVAIGWLGSPKTEGGGQLQSVETWRLKRSFELPADYGEAFQGSMFDFHRGPALVDASIIKKGTFAYDQDRKAAEAYFGGLSSVILEAENPSGPWDRTHIYVEQTPTGPEVVGFVLEVMQP